MSQFYRLLGKGYCPFFLIQNILNFIPSTLSNEKWVNICSVAKDVFDTVPLRMESILYFFFFLSQKSVNKLDFFFMYLKSFLNYLNLFARIRMLFEVLVPGSRLPIVRMRKTHNFNVFIFFSCRCQTIGFGFFASISVSSSSINNFMFLQCKCSFRNNGKISIFVSNIFTNG